MKRKKDARDRKNQRNLSVCVFLCARVCVLILTVEFSPENFVDELSPKN